MARLVRINKVLMKALKCSRREADVYIQSGYVKVGEGVVTELGTKVLRYDDDDDGSLFGTNHPLGTRVLDDNGNNNNKDGRVRVGLTDLGRREISRRGTTESRYGTVLYHKPHGVVSCQPDPGRCQVSAIQMCTSDREYRPPTTSSSSSAPLHRQRIIGKHETEDDDDDDDDDDDAKGPVWYEPSQHHDEAHRSRPTPHAKNNKGRVPSPQERLGWKVAGRLDMNSTGLLVLTTSGALASQILGNNHVDNPPAGPNGDDDNPHRSPRLLLPSSPRVEKEYLVRIPQLSSDPSSVVEDKLNQLRQGVMSGRDRLYDNHVVAKSDPDKERDDVMEMLTALRVKQINERQVQLVLDQGRRHHVRRMCREVGWDVAALKRVRIGRIRLDGLPYGFWRYLQPGETFLWPEQEQPLQRVDREEGCARP